MDATHPDGPPAPPMTMSPTQAAARTGFSEHFLRKKVRAGEIPCTRGGKGVIRFTQRDLDEAVEILRQPVTVKAKRLTSSKARNGRAA
jgi:excisionase family DNA binding protein